MAYKEQTMIMEHEEVKRPEGAENATWPTLSSTNMLVSSSLLRQMLFHCPQQLWECKPLVLGAFDSTVSLYSPARHGQLSYYLCSRHSRKSSTCKSRGVDDVF